MWYTYRQPTPCGKRVIAELQPAPKNLLVAVADPLTANALALMCRQEGYQVRTATSGKQALEIAAAGAPGCVILDLRLPDIGGMELRRQLRQIVSSPAIVLTSLREEAEGAAALGAAGDGYLTIPVGRDELAATLRRVYG
jgi:DNA-binding response OmpR family regulator